MENNSYMNGQSPYPAEPYLLREYGTQPGRRGHYEMIFHWNHLDWDFPNDEMKKEFYKKEYWKKCMPAGIKMDRQGHYYVSVPRWAHGVPATLNKIVIKDGKPLLEAFPSWEWNRAGNPAVLQSVLGYEIDEYNRMWILDQGKIAYERSPEGSQKLVIIDLDRNQLIDSIQIPNEIANYRTSFLNDVVVDNKNGFVYITDSGNGWPDHPLDGGIIVFNIRTRTFRRVLDRHFSTQDFPGFHFEIDNRPVFTNKPVKIGADGIALSGERTVLYYCQVTGRNLYAIDTSLLQDFQTPLEVISRSVRTVGSKGTTTDGMHADHQGNVFYTMLEGKGIGVYQPEDNSFHQFVSDDRMLWVDGVAFDQKGSIIFNSNRLHQMFDESRQDINWSYPYNLIIWKAFVGPDVKSYLYGL
ncbi:L-dopachrome tautomerase-related protein [Bacillus amyloliquefaciens]|uniref:L-dopachrome tautomerase-related protein n=1 Tax=Bacillus amyloliquefaciens TaxID=1390 RepID=UPI0025A26F7A|nr:L-dopachrome tautomerase-related protein [Bacillus amyloliquefaciens]WJM58180.1 L-dopachrome tautomerase-related protein [Bacillus amyloliquefaciens]